MYTLVIVIVNTYYLIYRVVFIKVGIEHSLNNKFEIFSSCFKFIINSYLSKLELLFNTKLVSLFTELEFWKNNATCYLQKCMKTQVRTYLPTYHVTGYVLLSWNFDFFSLQSNWIFFQWRPPRGSSGAVPSGLTIQGPIRSEFWPPFTTK